MDLVWAGDRRPYFATAPGAAGVRSLGYVDDADLPGLTRSPGVRPALALRGLRADLPGGDGLRHAVVAADRAALPETCGDAALLVDPDDGEALTAAVLIAAGDAAARAALRCRRAAARRPVQLGPDRPVGGTQARWARLSELAGRGVGGFARSGFAARAAARHCDVRDFYSYTRKSAARLVVSAGKARVGRRAPRGAGTPTRRAGSARAQPGIRPSPWNSAFASSSDTSGGGRMMSEPYELVVADAACPCVRT